MRNLIYLTQYERNLRNRSSWLVDLSLGGAAGCGYYAFILIEALTLISVGYCTGETSFSSMAVTREFRHLKTLVVAANIELSGEGQGVITFFGLFKSCK